MSVLYADYLIETPLEPARVAEILAGEQSSGTFVRIAGETDALRARSRANVVNLEELAPLPRPSLPNALLERARAAGPWRRARVTIAFPAANIGRNLPTLAATLAGNLYDLGETTGVRLLKIELTADFRDRFWRPLQGVAGTRRSTGVHDRPLIGTIIKPNVGLSPVETAALVKQLCEAGVDFIKDDECCADPQHAPMEQRIKAVMDVVRRFHDRTGRLVMVAFNITDEFDAMRRHADLVEREGGSCLMLSLNWVGFSAVQALRSHTGLAIHGHRNGFGMFSRCPALGMDFQPYQALWRLAGIDHMHVHGLAGKFAQADSEVIEGARDCLTPLASPTDAGDVVLPVFSSGQWAGTLPATAEVVPSGDFLFMCGGGILAHPAGVAAGVSSLHQAWQAIKAGQPLSADKDARALQEAIIFFGKAK